MEKGSRELQAAFKINGWMTVSSQFWRAIIRYNLGRMGWSEMQCGRGRSMYTIYIIIHNAPLALTMVRFPLWPCTKKYRLRTVWAFLSVLKSASLHCSERGGWEWHTSRERESVRWWGVGHALKAHHCPPPPPPPPHFFIFFIFKRPMYRWIRVAGV